MPADDDAVLIDNDCLTPSKFRDARSELVDRALGDLATVTGVWDQFVNWPPAHLQIVHPSPSRTELDLSEGALCASLSNRSCFFYTPICIRCLPKHLWLHFPL